MLDSILKFLKVLHGDVSPSQIAGGIMLGAFLGLTPFWSLHNVIVIFCICLFRVNIASAMVSFAVFSLFSYALDPLMNFLGEYILAAPSLQALWTSFYQHDLWRLAHFNNTLTMGSVVFSFILALPLFFISKFIIIKYREKVIAWVLKTRVVQALKATKWFVYVERVYSTVG